MSKNTKGNGYGCLSAILALIVIIIAIGTSDPECEGHEKEPRISYLDTVQVLSRAKYDDVYVMEIQPYFVEVGIDEDLYNEISMGSYLEVEVSKQGPCQWIDVRKVLSH